VVDQCHLRSVVLLASKVLNERLYVLLAALLASARGNGQTQVVKYESRIIRRDTKTHLDITNSPLYSTVMY
jgi:hypothetical protein